MKQKLESLAYICVIGLCLVSVGLRLEQRFRPAPDSSPAAAAQKLKGKRLEIPGVDTAFTRPTALLFVSSHCHFCEQSSPFYRQLSDMHRLHTDRMALSVLSLEAAETTKDFLANEHIAVDQVYKMASPVTGLNATPTILVLDRGGVVRNVFTGMLDEPHQREVLELLQRADL